MKESAKAVKNRVFPDESTHKVEIEPEKSYLNTKLEMIFSAIKNEASEISLITYILLSIFLFFFIIVIRSLYLEYKEHSAENELETSFSENIKLGKKLKGRVSKQVNMNYYDIFFKQNEKPDCDVKKKRAKNTNKTNPKIAESLSLVDKYCSNDIYTPNYGHIEKVEKPEVVEENKEGILEFLSPSYTNLPIQDNNQITNFNKDDNLLASNEDIFNFECGKNSEKIEKTPSVKCKTKIEEIPFDLFSGGKASEAIKTHIESIEQIKGKEDENEGNITNEPTNEHTILENKETEDSKLSHNDSIRQRLQKSNLLGQTIISRCMKK